MSSDFDQVMEEMQAAIIEDARKTYSEKVIQRWINPRQLGEIRDPQAYGKVTGPCGDTMHVFLKVSGGRVTEARFMTDGCASTIACGSIITELIKKKTISEAVKVSAADVIEASAGLPASSVHCAVLAAQTLQEAISNLLFSQKGKDTKIHS